MYVGYDRVSAKEQSLQMQEDALKSAGCKEIDNKIYALRNGKQIFIKRLYKVFNQSKVIAKSDNSLYPEIQIDLSSENADLKIVGQAVLRLEEAL